MPRRCGRVSRSMPRTSTTTPSPWRGPGNSAKAAEAVPQDFRERYLERLDDDRWAVRGELRRAVVFGRNDLVQDAPISRIDCSCAGKTLMYFTVEAQARILERLHFATARGGLLVLGKAETALPHLCLFSAVDSRRRFFAREELAAGQARRLVDVAVDPAAGDATELDRLHGEAPRSGPTGQVVISRSGRVTFLNRRATQSLPSR